MTSHPDYLIDRRRMRRKIIVWRFVAFAAFVLAMIAFATMTYLSMGGGFGKGAPHIARIPVHGFIANSQYAQEQLAKIRKDKNVKAIIVSVDSPGGTTVGGEALYKNIRRIAEEKPVVTSIGTLAASAGYMVAIASDHIVAPRTAIVGSVGVIMQYPNVSKLLDNIGVEFKEIKSSPLKAEPTPFKDTPPEARAMLESMLLDTYEWFVDLVKERRSLPDTAKETVLNGAVFTGQQALNRQLIDAIGGEEVAKRWLIDEKKVNAKLKIVDWSLSKPETDYFLGKALMNKVATSLGLGQVIQIADKTIASTQRTHLDGFLSVWQINENDVK